MISLDERIKSYVGALGRALAGTQPAGRGLTVFAEDVFIVSYLRSGSTWARFLFGNLVYEHEVVSFRNVDRLVPMIYDHPDRNLRKLPRLLKSHECFDPRYPTVIYLVRDPRDVAVSFYFYNRKVRALPDSLSLDEFVDRLLIGSTVPYADRLGCWEDHVLSWIRLRQGKNSFQMIRYEDLLDDPFRELTAVSPLLGMKPTAERIQRAINLSSADHMRKLEQREWKDWRTTKNTRQEIPFVREAKAGVWRSHLSENAVQKIQAAWGRTMREIGYELKGTENCNTDAVANTALHRDMTERTE